MRDSCWFDYFCSAFILFIIIWDFLNLNESFYPEIMELKHIYAYSEKQIIIAKILFIFYNF